MTRAVLIVLIVWHTAACAWSFYLHALDKRRAALNARRVPERVLLLTCILGGWFGGHTARTHLRHKTRKQPYAALFWTAAVLHLAWVIPVVLWIGALE